ncbi:putative bifunctional diguanylate cyclase/phosphodiesterase [Allorhizobium undicola]|uniref:putative bifunctional diguanylate cyclase/phosphodiesterase n=1 Tax=Allorhizobium undicola TaxID=78527 RepID=UPI003D347D8D
MLKNSKSIMLLNGACAITGTSLLAIKHGVPDELVWWIVSFLVVSAARMVLLRKLKREGFASARPRATIRLMALSAFFQGMVWALLPVFIRSLDLLSSDSAITLLLTGLICGAAIRQNGSSLVSFSFSAPIIISLAWTFITLGGYVGIITTIELTLLVATVGHRMVDSERRFLRIEVSKLENEAVNRSLTLANEDIRQKNLRLETLANGDPVTGLFNRIYFNGKMAGEIITAGVNKQGLALILIDIDRFKLINDAFGHRSGDQFLTIIGQRLRQAAGNSAIVSRISADEFAILMRGDDAAARSEALTTRILQDCREPIFLGSKSTIPSLSSGLAYFPDHANDADSLFTAASMALMEAKQAGRRQWRIFNPRIRDRIDRQRRIEQDLENAIRTGKVEAWFQPQLDLTTGAVVGFEALARWFHPELGAVSPPEIFGAAHAIQLSEQLTARIAEDACRLLQKLPDLGLPEATVAINISPRDFTLFAVSDMLDRMIETYDLPPHRLEVEITEEAMLDPEVAGEELHKLERAGYKLAVDDFGMGHTSLTYLIDLKIDRLKIDRSFVADVANNRTNHALIAAMVSLGTALNMEILVEGVETREELETLRRMGCDIGQGYFFSRPIPADMITNWLTQFRNKNPQASRAVA